MTIEPEPDGYCQPMITVERGDLDISGVLLLSDGELSQLGPLIDRYRAAQEVTPSVIGATFTDLSGREARHG